MRPTAALSRSLRSRDTRTLATSVPLVVTLLLSALVAYFAFRDVEANRNLVRQDALRNSREATFRIDAFLSFSNRMLVILALSWAIRGRRVRPLTAGKAAK